MKSRSVVLVALSVTLVVPSLCQAATYTVTDLGTLGGPSSAGFGINAGGQVTGLFDTGGEFDHAFLWSPTTPNGTSGTMQDLGLINGPGTGLVSAGRAINASGQVAGTSDVTRSGTLVRAAFLYDGAMSDLGTLAGTPSLSVAASEAWGINDSGHVTGGSHTAGNTAWHAFLYDGTMHDLGSLGGSYSMGLDVNAGGQVTGESSLTGDANSHAFRYDGMLHDLGTLGGTSSAGWGINDSGQVTGYSYTTGDATFRAFLYDGTLHDLGTLGGPDGFSYGRAINAHGHVVGYSSATGGSSWSHAFLYESGAGIVDLNSLIDPLSGWELESAYGINDAGQITGTGFNGSEYHAYLLTPVPEPSTAVLAALACGMMMWRRWKYRTTAGAFLVIALFSVSRLASAVTIETAPVGNAGNAHDPSSGNLYGGVGYNYRIGTAEVTVGQYTAFLNAVAADDTYGLYNLSMTTDLNIGRIARSGAPGSYIYSIVGGADNFPVTYVSWGDAARFANWLHNNQPTGAQSAGTTETGAYTLNGATSDATLNAVMRNANATWFVPSESEWYKAAYYQPASQGGDADSYWLYPMRTNSTPYSDQPPGTTPDNTRVGNIYAEDDPNLVNGYNDGYAVTGSTSYSSSQNYLTEVGAYTSSSSFYGTFDQGGNVWEWNEAISGSFRGSRGGSWFYNSILMRSSYWDSNYPTIENFNLGFRIATVPEPSSLFLVGAGLGSIFALALLRRRTAGTPTRFLAAQFDPVNRKK